MPATVVEVGPRAWATGATNADRASRSVSRMTRPRERRAGLLIAGVLHEQMGAPEARTAGVLPLYGTKGVKSECDFRDVAACRRRPPARPPSEAGREPAD